MWLQVRDIFDKCTSMYWTVCVECVPSGNYVCYTCNFFPLKLCNCVCLPFPFSFAHFVIFKPFQFYRWQLQCCASFFFKTCIWNTKAGISYRMWSCPFGHVSFLLLLSNNKKVYNSNKTFKNNGWHNAVKTVSATKPSFSFSFIMEQKQLILGK